MKKSLQLFVMAVLMLGAASCELVQDLVVVEEAGDSKFTFDVNEPEGVEAFSRVKTVKMGLESDQKAIFKDVTINSISVHVPSHSGSEAHILSDLELYYVATGAEDTLRVGTINDIDLFNLHKTEGIAYVKFDDKARDDAKLKEIMLADGSVDFKLRGKNESKKAIKTKLEFTVNASIKVKPLEN